MVHVAEVAGVSVPTVSKVLNGRADVSEATRSRVLKAVSATGYLPRLNASSERSGIIDLLIESVASPWALEILRGAEAEAAHNGSAVAVSATMRPDFSIKRWLASVAARRSDGVIFVLNRPDHEELDALRELQAGVVLLDPVGESEPELATVGATNWNGALEATEYLIGLGHTRIGFIGGPQALRCSLDRYEGYVAALRRHQLDLDPSLVVWEEFRSEGGSKGADALFAVPERPTAIFASSDQQAAGVFHAARLQGLSIPRDLSVVGFDDTILGEYMSPRLTTVRQPLDDMAREAVRLLFERRSARTDAPRIELSTSLVVRDSAAPPAARR
jgi:DNA-binding LacI/PurR family transcriptional regulator